MPGAATHTTIIQHLADLANPKNGANANPQFQAFLTDPNLNADWATYGNPEALQSRYAVLGAMGPDIFYLMLDYGASQQDFEDLVVKLAGTFSCVGKLSGELNNLINSTLDTLTDDVWKEIQASFTFLKGILVDGVLDLLVDQNNFWFFFLPLREVDDYRENWYWADFLHYVKTGCFTQKLLDICKAYQAADPYSANTRCLSAYALGYLTHYVADTIGHAYVNRIVESPWRNAWQRHHLVENFIDAYVWASWHDKGADPNKPSTEEQALDTINAQSATPTRSGAASLHYARLNDLCNIGSPGLDTTLDGVIGNVCDLIQQRVFDLKLSQVPKLQPPDDPIFKTWTQVIADAMWQTYSVTSDHPSRMGGAARMGGFPTADDIAGAYGAYRLILSLATEDDVEQPKPPDLAGDLLAILRKLVADIKKDVGSVPPPPSEAGGSFSLDALAKAVKDYIKWLGQVAEAAIKVLGDLISALIQAGVAVGADTIKAGLFLLNTILYSIYHSLRMVLVMSAYSVPFTEDLMGSWGPLDLSTLWNASSDGSPQRYPIEPVLSERDFGADSTHPYSPYRPYFAPSSLAPVNVESPATSFHPNIMSWTMPDDMLSNGAPGIDNMFSAAGTAPATTVPLMNPDGKTKLVDLESFDGSQRYFGTIFDNCSTALGFAIPYLLGTPYPEGTTLPDYNLDCDRGFAWPCWDVDYEYQNPVNPFPWNGADPFPADTIKRVNTPLIPFFPATPNTSTVIDWGDKAPKPTDPGLRSGLTTNDPWGSPRMGDAWINATALNPTGTCQYAEFPFPAIVVNPKTPRLQEMDRCLPEESTNRDPPSFGLLSRDYRFAPHAFLHSNPDVQNPVTEDVLQVFLHLPYSTKPTPENTTLENDQRLADFLRALALTADPKKILANAVSLWMRGGTTPLDLGGRPIPDPSPIPIGSDPERAALVTAVAQLAVTGRNAFKAFVDWVPHGIPHDADLVQAVHDCFPGVGFDPTLLQATAHSVLDTAYTTLWAIRSNDPGWRAFRSQLGWIAVSGFDDTPHRPVNVPTAPYPQYDLDVDVPYPPYPNSQKPGVQRVTTRYMVASAGIFVGPGDPISPILAAPAQPVATPPAPRAIPPQDAPTIPAGNKIIIYIHGGGSRTEEAVDMASWLIVEGKKVGQDYTVISFDLPNSAYASSFDVQKIMVGPYDHHNRYVLQFEQRFIIEFIEKLDQTLGDVKGRIVAVMGGSLGGNTSLLMTDWYDQNHSYLQTIVAWSATAIAPAYYLGIISAGDLAAYLGHQEDQIRDTQEDANDHGTEVKYIQEMYIKPLIPAQPAFLVPAQPIMWYRGGYAPDGAYGWQPCKDRSIAGSRFDRYEIYSPYSRHWTIAIDLEQISFSFQEERAHLSVVTKPSDGAPTPNLMLVAGEHDNFFPNAIYNSTLDLARAIRMQAHGKAEFWLDTGHSFHNERPHLFASEIVYYLTHLDAGDSPYGVVVSTPPHADYSRVEMVDQ